MVARHARRRSRGQIVPIAALIAVLLFAFAALVLDGGRGYLDRRGLQSTADMSALSGAAQLGKGFKTNKGATDARLAAVREAVNNLPGTTYPAKTSSNQTYTGTADATGLKLGNQYTMDLWATITQVRVKLHHTLSLTFGVAAGLGLNITPAAEATAINGKIAFAVILFRDACIGGNNGGVNCGNLTNSGTGTHVDVTSADNTETGDGLTNETVCPAPGIMDFHGQGNQYAFNPPGFDLSLGSTQFPSSGCGTVANITNVRCMQSPPDPSPCYSPLVPMVSWPSQLSDPLYPEPLAPTGCPSSSLIDDTTHCNATLPNGTACLPPGTYNSINVKQGDLVLAHGVYRITGEQTNADSLTVSGSSGKPSAVWTQDQYAPLHGGSTPCGPQSDDGVILEFKPQAFEGGSGAGNQLKVSGFGILNITGSPVYDHVVIFVERNTSETPTTEFPGTTGGGSQVVTFGSGAQYNIKGTVYGYADNMTFAGGNVQANGVGQILAWTVKLTGGGTLNQTYDPSQLPSKYGLLK